MPTIELTDAEAKILTEALQVAEESYRAAAHSICKGPNHGDLPLTDQQAIKHFTDRGAECKRIALKLCTVNPKPKRRKARK